MVTRQVTSNLIASTFIKEESLLTTIIFSYYTRKDEVMYVQTLVQGETTKGCTGLFRSVKQQNLPQQNKFALPSWHSEFQADFHAFNGKGELL